MSNEINIEDALGNYREFSLNDSRCFLCGSSENLTKEHVFPKWLQHKFNLWDKKITLVNGSKIPYRMLTIPCCKPCNGSYLSKLEEQIKSALDDGYESAMKLDPNLWYLWFAKIYYGQLRKECSLPMNRTHRSGPSILNEEKMKESYFVLHLALQSIRGKVKLAQPPYGHYSVIICNFLGKEGYFDYRDNIASATSFMAFNDIGIILAFEDNGLISLNYDRAKDQLKGKKLLINQLEELYAEINHDCYRQSPVHFTFAVDTRGINSITIDGHGGGVLAKYDHRVHLEFLLGQLGKYFKQKDIDGFIKNRTRPTFLYDDNYNIVTLSEEK